MKKLSHILPLLLLLLVAASCHKKQLTEEATAPVVVPQDTITRQTLWQPAFQTGRIRATVDIKTGTQQLSCPITITYVADSIIVFSIQPFAGMEALRLEADEQEIRILDKMQKRFCPVTYPMLSEAMGGGNMAFQALEQIVETILQEGVTDTEYPIIEAGISGKLMIQSLQKNGNVSAQRLNTQSYQQISITELIGLK